MLKCSVVRIWRIISHTSPIIETWSSEWPNLVLARLTPCRENVSTNPNRITGRFTVRFWLWISFNLTVPICFLPWLQSWGSWPRSWRSWPWPFLQRIGFWVLYIHCHKLLCKVFVGPVLFSFRTLNTGNSEFSFSSTKWGSFSHLSPIWFCIVLTHFWQELGHLLLVSRI